MGALTNLQLETLGLIRDGGVCEINTGYAAWRIQGATPSVVGRLRSLGLAKTSFDGVSTYNYQLTEAGEAALALATPSDTHEVG